MHMTAVDWYKKIAPNKKKIMCFESASDYLNLSNGWLDFLFLYYDSGYIKTSNSVVGYKVNNLQKIDYVEVEGVLVTSPEQTLFDLFKNKRNIQSSLIGMLRYRDLYDSSLIKLKNFSEKRNFKIDWDEQLQRAILAYEDYE